MTTRFVAIGVAPVVRERLDAAIAPVRGRRAGLAWTDPLGWHVTLAFLGRLPDTAVPGIVAALGAAVLDGPGDAAGAVASEARALPRLVVGRVTSFGARVLVVEVEDDPVGRVAAWGARVQTALAEAGFPVHERAVRAHVTLARARRGSRIGPGLVAETQRALDEGPDTGGWQPRSIGVLSSHPRSDGPARYLVDAEVAVPR